MCSRPQRLHDCKTVIARQHPVDNQDGIAAVRAEKEARVTFLNMVDDVTGLFKPALDVGGGFAIVFDDEQLHVRNGI